MLVNANRRTVDHHDLSIVTLRHISPGRTRPETPQNAVDQPAAIDTFNSTAIVRQKGCNDRPFFVAQFVPAHSISFQGN
jgi:hypothetical protein